MKSTRFPSKSQDFEPLVLVGFGKKDLPEIMELIGTEKEMEAITAPLHAPPRWRRVSIGYLPKSTKTEKSV
jgi:hypothetical protein